MSDWWYIATYLSESQQATIARWVLEQDWPEGTTLHKPSRYHTTLVYSYDGRGREDLPPRLARVSSHMPQEQFVAHAKSIECFTDALGRPMVPVVITLNAPKLVEHVEHYIGEFKQAGYKVSEFEGGYKPHITVAMVPQGSIIEMEPPAVGMRIGHATISSLKEKS